MFEKDYLDPASLISFVKKLCTEFLYDFTTTNVVFAKLKSLQVKQMNKSQHDVVDTMLAQ